MQGVDIIEHTNGKYYVFYILVCKGKTFLRMLMPSDICAHFSQIIDRCVT